MLKQILLQLFRPNHQPEILASQTDTNTASTHKTGAAFAAELIEGYWTRNKAVNEQHSSGAIKSIARKLTEDCSAVLASPDPKLANRRELVESVTQCAMMQVLLIPAAPAPDQTGLRGKLGISGDLKTRILDIAKVDPYFKDFPHKQDAEKALGEIQNAYRRAWARMNIFEAFRHEFNDLTPDLSDDWLKPLFASQCAYAEFHYRQQLGMDCDAASGSAYEAYKDAVLTGAESPNQVWGQAHPGLTHPQAALAN